MTHPTHTHVQYLIRLSMCIIKLLELNIEHVCGLGGLSMCIIKLLELNITHTHVQYLIPTIL
jgi:hypothetical protein